ncbi:MAG: PilT/PilU family type 4a pilus ATPase [Erysipelotrichaceae bacterium]|nr:PilT/PilU family type 4a pilus ATPase [Erysipelotrichaceae bacterium]
MEELVKLAKEKKASDLHLVYGLKPSVRVHGSLKALDLPVLDDNKLESLAKELGVDITNLKEHDMAKTIDNTRCRINVFKQQNHISIALRLLSDTIPDISVLGLPKIVEEIIKLRKGIVLVTGETGSGKSTTLASLIDAINHTYEGHIITLEDPVEYLYKPDKCIINQREVGQDTESFSDGLRASLREDPDIILLGELRDADTIETALTAAETGHLVFATLHTNGAGDTIDRIISAVSEGKKDQIRMQLSTTLKYVLAQQLLPRIDSEGRVLAYEVMKVNSAIANLIREGKTPSIQNAIATSARIGNITMDNCLINLVKERKISKEEAVLASNDADYVKNALNIY